MLAKMRKVQSLYDGLDFEEEVDYLFNEDEFKHCSDLRKKFSYFKVY